MRWPLGQMPMLHRDEVLLRAFVPRWLAIQQLAPAGIAKPVAPSMRLRRREPVGEPEAASCQAAIKVASRALAPGCRARGLLRSTPRTACHCRRRAQREAARCAGRTGRQCARCDLGLITRGPPERRAASAFSLFGA